LRSLRTPSAPSCPIVVLTARVTIRGDDSAALLAALVGGGGEAAVLASLDLSPQPMEISASVNAVWLLVLPE
jgi:hypothetical protein